MGFHRPDNYRDEDDFTDLQITNSLIH